MFFFNTKKKLTKTSLLQGMTDVHSHLLPGVDDGFKNRESTALMLDFLAGLGVERMILTPHISDEFPLNTPEFLKERLQMLQGVTPANMTLQLAAEYMIDSGFAKRMEAGLMTLSDNKVLVETSYLTPPFDLDETLYSIGLAGYQPVIAHPERYMYMEDSDYRKLKDSGYLFQLNLFSLSGMYGSLPAKKARELLKNGAYDFVGSDCHSARGYRAGMNRLKLSASQISALSELMTNNTLL